MRLLELGVPGDVDDVEVERDLTGNLVDDLERALAQVAARGDVERDEAQGGYG